MKNLEVSLVRHTKITDDHERFFEIQNRDWYYLIEKVITAVENLNKTELSIKESKTVGNTTSVQGFVQLRF